MVEAVAETAGTTSLAGPTRRIRSFLEVVAILFVLGLILESVVLLSGSGVSPWTWALVDVAALIGLVGLMSREPANL